MEEEKYEFYTSHQGFKDFIEGGIWKDIKHEMGALLEVVDTALRKEKDPAEFYTWQGRASAIEDIITMIEGFGEEIEEQALKDLDFEDEEDNSINQELYDIEED